MAPPKKWDDESEDESSDEESVDVKPVAARRKFDDEEDSDDVADNWDEAEDSEEERAKAAKAAAAKAKADAEAAKNKKSKSQRIEEHREANRKKRISDLDDEESSEEEEDEADRRARLRKSEQDSDLKHAEDLFSAMNTGKNRSAPKAVVIEDKSKPGQAIDLSSLALFKPNAKPEFEALGEVLVPLLRASSSKPHYSIWITNFCKQICADMPSAEIKKTASTLTALSNEKMKEEKMADKSGKKTKAAKTKTTLAAGRDMGRGVADTTAYDDGLDEDDFM